MRKSTELRRPSLSGAPLRVRQDNIPSHGNRPSSVERASSLSSKLPVSKRMSSGLSSQQFRPRQSSTGRSSVQDHRKSTSMCQMSFVPKSGRPSSGIGVRGRTDLPKDTRPISDKRYQSQCISSLLEFLTSHKYPHPISHKLLSSPSNRDFSNIFEFIMGHFWEDYKLNGSKIQEVVPSTLKLLGYPFNLPKTYLCSVGSPHTWPHLLAALTWMIELLQIKNSIGGDIDRLMFLDSAGDDFDGMSDEKIAFDYKERIFNAFMAGADSFEEEDQALEKIFMEKYHGGDINVIIEENKQLENILDDAEKMEDKISSLKEHYKFQKQREKQFRDYLEQMQRHKMALVTEMEKCSEELAIAKSDLEKEESRLNGLKIAYESQELKPADVERLKAEQDRLHAQVEQLEKRIAEMDADIWQLNMEQAKHNEKLQEDVAKYNRLAIALKIVPESAECADGKDFRLHMGVSSDLVMNFQHNIKPKLMLMKKNLNEHDRSSKKEQFSLVCNIEKMQEMLNDKKERLIQKEKELSQMETEIEMLKKASTTEHKSMSEELRKLEQDVAQLNTNLAQQKTEYDNLLETFSIVQDKLAMIQSEGEQEINKVKEARMEMRVRVKEYADSVKKQLMEVLQQSETASADASKKLALAKEASQKRRQRFGLQ